VTEPWGGTPPGAGELDALFVDPSHIGSGCGRALLAQATEIAAAEGMTCLGITSDPFAQDSISGLAPG